VHDMAERMHGALCRAWELLLEVLPDGRLDRRDGYRVVSAPSFPVVPFNAVWVDGPDDHPAAHDLEASLASIAARGVAPGVITRDDRYPAVESEAGRLGLGLDEREVGMVLMRSGFRPPAGPGPRLVRVGQDPALLAVAKDVTVRGFEAPPEVFDGVFSSGMGVDGLSLWLAFVEDEPVSTALGLVIGDAVGVFDVATPPEHRRNGYAAWVTSEAIRAGFEAGAGFAYLQASEIGLGVYRALGFGPVCGYRLFAAESDDAIPP
jgi:ribosomal protein S18 acetylase RimI-like enzyme